MLKMSFFGLLIASTMALAHHNHEVSAIHVAQGNVEHPGDAADFLLRFEASCHTDASTARRDVIAQVARMGVWLNEAKAQNINSVMDWSIDLISVWQQPYLTYDNNNCAGKYSAQQDIKISLKKMADKYSLDSSEIKSFFEELQRQLALLDSIGNNSDGMCSSKIISVEKSVLEETAILLRIAAKAQARETAKREFLAGLGPDYRGYWYIYSEDFSENHYGRMERAALSSFEGGNQPGGPAMSEIKLPSVSLSVQGSFHFHFQPQYQWQVKP